MIKSPFLIYQDFLTEDEAYKMANELRVKPDRDPDENALVMKRHHKPLEMEILDKFLPMIPEIEEYFNFEYKSMESIEFVQYPTTSGKLAEQPHCDNAVYKRKKWIRVHGRDLSCLIWLKAYEDKPPFDIHKHVYGGKLEFPIYNFSFQPQVGSLVIFPSNERFIQATSSILVGELQTAKFYLHGTNYWHYDPNNFPGDFRSWFNQIV